MPAGTGRSVEPPTEEVNRRMADSAQNKPSRSQADKERSRQQSRPVNARDAGKTGTGGRRPPKPKGGGGATGSGAKGARPGGRPSSAARNGKGGGPVRRPTAPGGSRSSTALLTWGIVAVVLVIVIVLVVVKVTGNSQTSSTNAVKPGPVPANIVSEVTHVPSSVFDAVGVTSPSVTVTSPRVESNQPPLTFGGKPGFFFMGGEYCPFCAAERWSVVAALSRFGTVSGLETMASAATDYAPNTQTFTFAHAKFSSQYVAASLKEIYSNVKTSTGRAYQPLEKLTKPEAAAAKKYASTSSTTSSGTIPFMDVGNKLIFSGASYSPTILQNLSRAQIAAGLSTAKNPVTQAIIATANYLSAGLCSIDHGQPGNVCTSKGVTAAAAKLGITTT